MITYKIDILAALKEKGLSTYRIRKDKVLSESTLQMIRSDQLVSFAVLDKLCDLLGCDVGDLLHHVPGEKGAADGEV